jgi:hypothetical protein
MMRFSLTSLQLAEVYRQWKHGIMAEAADIGVIPMFLHVKDVKYLHDYVIWLRFNDGAEGEIDLRSELDGEVFAPLNDKSKFRQFGVDPELGTIVWENGTDLAPEFLYENMKVMA